MEENSIAFLMILAKKPIDNHWSTADQYLGFLNSEKGFNDFAKKKLKSYFSGHNYIILRKLAKMQE